jgi:hypothetical protein
VGSYNGHGAFALTTGVSSPRVIAAVFIRKEVTESSSIRGELSSQTLIDKRAI